MLLFENEVIDLKDMLKVMQKEYHMTQAKLAGKYMTRQNISRLEEGAPITPNAALHIAETFNNHAKKNHLNVSITPEILEADKQTQVARIFKQGVNKLKQITDIDEFKASLDEFEIFIKEYEDYITTEDKYKLNEIVIDEYCSNNLYLESKPYILRNSDLAKLLNDSERITRMAHKMVLVCSIIGDFKDVILYGNNYIISEYANSETSKGIYFNTARAYILLHDSEECMATLRILQEYCKLNDKENFDVELMFANCLFEDKKYKDAEQAYKDLLKKAELMHDNNNLCMCYGNIAMLKHDTKQYYEAIALIEKALSINTNFYGEQTILPYINYAAFTIYLSANKYELAKDYFNITLESSVKSNSQDNLYKIFKEMIEYCIKNNMANDVIAYIEKLEQAIYKKYITNSDVKDLFYKASRYFYNKDTNKFDMMYSKIFNIIEFMEEKK